MFETLTAADGHDFQCWIQPAEGTAKGGVVILQEIFGVTDQLKGVAARYAAQGYDVAIPALFDRQMRDRGVWSAAHEVPALTTAAAEPSIRQSAADLAPMGAPQTPEVNLWGITEGWHELPRHSTDRRSPLTPSRGVRGSQRLQSHLAGPEGQPYTWIVGIRATDPVVSLRPSKCLHARF